MARLEPASSSFSKKGCDSSGGSEESSWMLRRRPSRARFLAQARAVAIGAGARVEVLGELLLHGDRIGLAVAALEVGQDPRTDAPSPTRGPFARIAEGDLLLARAVQDACCARLQSDSKGCSTSKAVEVRASDCSIEK